MGRKSTKLRAAIAIGAWSFITAVLVVFVRFMSPTDWKRVATSPRAFVATIVAYRQVSRMTPAVERANFWDYEVVLESAPPGQIHVIYVPRMHVDNARKDPQHPGAHIRVSSGIEAHVFIDDATLNVERAYLAD
jgi:hypothetical protein